MNSIQIKWVYSPKEDNEVRVLVDKTPPHGRELHDLNVDLWCPQVSPSQTILRQLQKEEINNKAFVHLYRHEMHLEPEKLTEVVAAAKHGRLTLVTAQRDPLPAWLETLKNMLETRLIKASGY